MLATKLMRLLRAILMVTMYRVADFEADIARLFSIRLRVCRRLELRLLGIRPPRHFWIGSGLRLCSLSGKVLLGERCMIGENARIGNYADVTIGDDFLAAPGLTIDTGTHDPLTLEPTSKPVNIGRNVWCGTNVTILPGISIGENAIIGAGSVVTRDIPSNSIAVGVPARVIRALTRDAGMTSWSAFTKPDNWGGC
jgi:maltose O-acetyltransferase